MDIKNMDLKTFVSSAIKEIMEGVKDAQAGVAATGGLVNPGDALMTKGTSELGQARINGIDYPVQEFSFDIAVAVGETKENSGGVGIVVAMLSLGAQGKAQSENSTISRISFRVPVVFAPGANVGVKNRGGGQIYGG